MINYISPSPSEAYAAKWPRRLSVLGSTGSIGRSALAVMAERPDSFSICGLAGARNMRLLAEQAAEWRPAILGVQDEAARLELLPLLPTGYSPDILIGPDGYAAMAGLPEADAVLCAQMGAAGLTAALAAARAGKVIALANKEALVLAGGLIRSLCGQTKAAILPVDSEHNAIFQSLQGQDRSGMKRLVLTASGGPFLGKTREELAGVRKEAALAHPNWSMGAKISIDSATMMNKGLEIIEACHLYGLGEDKVSVLVHPQSVVHSLVEYLDGSMLAQLGPPDMRVPLAHCLGWPVRVPSGAAPLDLTRYAGLRFMEPDLSSFPALSLCRRVIRAGGDLPIVLNAANETAVALFLQDRISFTGISDLVERAMDGHTAGPEPGGAEEILDLDSRIRRKLEAWIK